MCLFITLLVCNLFIYNCYMRISYKHSALFVRDAIFPHCTLVYVATLPRGARAKTSKTERLNSAWESTNLAGT